MLAHRAILTLGVIAGAAAVYYLVQAGIESLRVVTTVPAEMTNQATIDNLRVRLDGNYDGPLPFVKVTVENTHPSQALTLLRWDSPLDQSCFRTGVLSIIDTASRELVEGPGVKINRKLPPAREDLIEIQAKAFVESQLPLNEPWMPVDGGSVTINARGTWRAVWLKAEAEVTANELESMSGAGLVQGTFTAETVVQLKSQQ